jgi:hypothetical protein
MGHADEVDWRTRTVVDLKTVNQRGWDRAITYGPWESAWHQVQMYGYGLWLMDSSEPWTVAIVTFNRETGEEARFERDLDPDLGEELLVKLIQRQADLDTSESPDDLPREGKGPGRGFPCDWCEWRTACWPPPGDDLGPMSPQSITIADDPEQIQQMAEVYFTASVAEKEASNLKADARAFLAGIPAGSYGGVKLKWSGGKPIPGKPDTEAMIEILQANGFTVPYRPPTNRSPSIGVTRVVPLTDKAEPA